VHERSRDKFRENAVRLLLLGTTGYHPNEQRHTACFMIPEAGIVFDAGTAMFRVREHLETPTLDIFLSHAHLDHVVGLTYLLNIVRGRSVKEVRVHGEASKLAAIQRSLFSEALFPVLPDVVWTPLSAPVSLLCGATIRYFPLKHPGGSVGYRVEWRDRSLAYVTDTTAAADADYVDEIRGVDLLVHECHFGDGWESQAELTGHSCTSGVAQVALAARVRRLVLVHIDPMAESPAPAGIQTAREIFPKIEVGQDGAVIEF
jgi:ribonuclease BN (tRNA processing enzyme)